MARAAGHAVDPYLPPNELARRYAVHLAGMTFPHPSPHPPPVAILLLPISTLSYSTAAYLWLALGVASVAGAVYLFLRGGGRRPLPWEAPIAATALLSWAPIREDLFFGNVNCLLLLALALAWFFLRQGRSGLGGAALGLAILIKPVPWPVLLVPIVRRDWRATAVAVLAVIGGYATVMLMVGPVPIIEYATAVLPSVTEVYRASWQNLSLWSVGWRVFQGTGSIIWGDFVQLQTSSVPLVAWPFAARMLSFALPAATTSVACLALARIRSIDASLGLMICISLLISPVFWDHYRALTAIPIAVVFIWLARKGFPSRQTNRAIILAGPSLISFPAWATLAFWADGKPLPADFVSHLSFGASLLTLGPTAAVVALVFLVVTLGSGGVWQLEHDAPGMAEPLDLPSAKTRLDLGHTKRDTPRAPPLELC